MTEEIINAINEMRRLRISYPPGLRLIEPHVLGRSSKGNLLLRAYQVSGASDSGEQEGWKLFRLDSMGPVEVAGETFLTTRPLYNPNDSAMLGGIIASVPRMAA